jgi:hypothetical protein
MLAGLYGLKQFAVHKPQDLDWMALPDQSIVQLHWYHEPVFTALLADHGFQAVTIARHPLSVLLSIWQFAPHEPQTAQWLQGDGGNESAILNRPIESDEFIEYACGPRARALLSVSAQWWGIPDVLKIRYEDLVHQPEVTLGQLCAPLGEPNVGLREALDANTLEKLRPTSSNNHFWQGKPDTWRQMIPQRIALEV